MAETYANPQEHVEFIRTNWFSIGQKDENKLAVMLDTAVKYLSAELYTKDVHFLMELVQNAEDNTYPEDVNPSLELIITSDDVTMTGAQATLIMLNNERGFSAKNIESICSVGNSTKAGQRKNGYIGEKGIGFKSVFLISSQPHVISNGYQIRFNEKPCPHCKLGFIVPEWVGDEVLQNVKDVYGSASKVPTTVLVLPLKADKVAAVKHQLSRLEPEILLFLSKIKHLSVREHSKNSTSNTVCSINITKDINFESRKTSNAESYTLCLSGVEDGNENKECSYYMWKQRFPVKSDYRVERRMEIDEWVITLAFPNNDRLQRGGKYAGVYAFLPTEMVTNFPFIIQADFILASSRETILLDNKWNKGILECVPLAFVNALDCLVKSVESAPISSLPRQFNFIPIKSSPYEALNTVRSKIRSMLVTMNIIPMESEGEQKVFLKPGEVGRVSPSFRDILSHAKIDGLNICNLSSNGWYILHSSFDRTAFDDVLDFLGVDHVENDWYAKSIRSMNLVSRSSDGTYLRLLNFVAKKWDTQFRNTLMSSIPLIRYVSYDGICDVSSVNSCSSKTVKICRCSSPELASWLIKSNSQFSCPGSHFFLSESLHKAMCTYSGKESVVKWLESAAKVKELSVYWYSNAIQGFLVRKNDVVSYAHFLYWSGSQGFIPYHLSSLCKEMPLLDKDGCVKTKRSGVLVPANGSNWSRLVFSNLRYDYVELSEDYLSPLNFAGKEATRENMLEFLKSYIEATDVPFVRAPTKVPAASSPLTQSNAFMLLGWLKNLNRCYSSSLSSNFLNSIGSGSWLKVAIDGTSAYKPPSESFYSDDSPNSVWSRLLDNSAVLIDVPMVDKEFYGSKISSYKEELRSVGVMFESKQLLEFVGGRLMSIAISGSLNKTNVFCMLGFVRSMKQFFLPLDSFVSKMQQHSWLVTTKGNKYPKDAVLYEDEWSTAKLISDIPFIDEDYYGAGITGYKDELKLLGVIVGFNQRYELVENHVKSYAQLGRLSADAFLLLLRCIRNRKSSVSSNLLNNVEISECVKTDKGYNVPTVCHMSDPQWNLLLKIFQYLPSVDTAFYGEAIFSFKKELKLLGVQVDFKSAVEAFSFFWKDHARDSTISVVNALDFLSCYRMMEAKLVLRECAVKVPWLRTRLGNYKSPEECVLYNPQWELISNFTLLPFIDDNWYGERIHEFQLELKEMGVIVNVSEGVKMISSCIRFPVDTSLMTPETVLTFLDFVKMSNAEKSDGVPITSSFLEKISVEFLKTHVGYRSPNRSCLFDDKWKLKPTDGPFIDEEFYGPKIRSYKSELNAIHVVIDPHAAIGLIGENLESFSNITVLTRIYSFLKEYRWKPGKDRQKEIWIPCGEDEGRWANSAECVLHDKEGLFESVLCVLDKYYPRDLLCFFSDAYGVKLNPSFDDFKSLWKRWEGTETKLSEAQCAAFWKCVSQHWGVRTKEVIVKELEKLPALAMNGEILLREKKEVFLADDLLLKDLFKNESVFVWLPGSRVAHLPRSKLLEIYSDIGVQRISNSVKVTRCAVSEAICNATPEKGYFEKALVKLILGFLAGPAVNLEVKKRHAIVQSLLSLAVKISEAPIELEYCLELSGENKVTVITAQMVRWCREIGSFVVQKLDKGSKKDMVIFAGFFAEEVSQGLLWEMEEHVAGLSELIKFTFLLDFDEEAVEVVMKSKNLQIYDEDEAFISTIFSSSSVN